MDLISRQAAIEALLGITAMRNTIPLDSAIFNIKKLPSVQPEHMHTVMLKIAEKYEKAMNTSCILNPMAWALYQTWKEYDR